VDVLQGSTRLVTRRRRIRNSDRTNALARALVVFVSVVVAVAFWLLAGELTPNTPSPSASVTALIGARG